MGKKVLAVIIGYLSTAVTVFISFTILYFILGTEGAFVPNSYNVSITWIIYSLIINIVAALIGGFVCQLISQSRNTSLVLAIIIFVLGMAMAVGSLNANNEYAHTPREGEISNFDAMQRAQQPSIVLLLNPIIGSFGVYLGSRFKSEKK